MRKAAVNELVSLKPSSNAISVTDVAGFASSVLACSMRRLLWYQYGGTPRDW